MRIRSEKFFAILVLLVFLAGCSHVRKAVMAVDGDPFPAHPSMIDLGSEVYAAHCASCHGERGEGDGVEIGKLSSAPPNFVDGSFQKSLGLVAANIAYGKREMPSFRDSLTERELWAVSRFVKSLAPSDAP